MVTVRERWRGLWRVGLFEEVCFEPRQELTARDGQKRLERGARVGSAEEPKGWREGFPKPGNEMMETAV